MDKQNLSIDRHFHHTRKRRSAGTSGDQRWTMGVISSQRQQPAVNDSQRKGAVGCRTTPGPTTPCHPNHLCPCAPVPLCPCVPVPRQNCQPRHVTAPDRDVASAQEAGIAGHFLGRSNTIRCPYVSVPDRNLALTGTQRATRYRRRQTR